MSRSVTHPTFALFRVLVAAFAMMLPLLGAPVQAQSTAFKQAVAEAASGDPALAEFYRVRDFAPLWTSSGDRSRRAALLKALDTAWVHGLPEMR